MTLLSPVITEKSISLAAKGVYTFRIDPAKTKFAVAAAVESQFGVTVTRVTLQKSHVPAVRTGRRRLLTLRPRQKYARVTLAKGQSIPLFDLKDKE